MAVSGTATPYPFDFDALQKGDIIPVTEIEHITGVNVHSALYSLEAQKICERIEEELLARDKPVTCCQIKSAIHILTDLEASEYNARRQDAQIRAVRRQHKKLVRVDGSEFSSMESKTHHARILRSSNRLFGVKRADKISRKGITMRDVEPSLKSMCERARQIEDKRSSD